MLNLNEILCEIISFVTPNTTEDHGGNFDSGLTITRVLSLGPRLFWTQPPAPTVRVTPAPTPSRFLAPFGFWLASSDLILLKMPVTLYSDKFRSVLSRIILRPNSGFHFLVSKFYSAIILDHFPNTNLFSILYIIKNLVKFSSWQHWFRSHEASSAPEYGPSPGGGGGGGAGSGHGSRSRSLRGWAVIKKAIFTPIGTKDASVSTHRQ